MPCYAPRVASTMPASRLFRSHRAARPTVASVRQLFRSTELGPYRDCRLFHRTTARLAQYHPSRGAWRSRLLPGLCSSSTRISRPRAPGRTRSPGSRSSSRTMRFCSKPTTPRPTTSPGLSTATTRLLALPWSSGLAPGGVQRYYDSDQRRVDRQEPLLWAYRWC